MQKDDQRPDIPLLSTGEDAPYLPLKDVLQQVKLSRSVLRGYYPPATIKALSYTPGLVDMLTKDLEKEGFRRFRYFREGSNAIILETVDNQLVRISAPVYDAATKIYAPDKRMHSSDPYSGYGVRNSRIWHPIILQPISTHDYENEGKPYLRYEVLPKLHRIYGGKAEDRDKIKIIEEALHKSGISILDLDNKNVGSLLLPDGREILLALDVGMAVFRKDPRTCGTGEHLKPWLTPDGHFLQCEAEPRIKSHPKRQGTPSGVVPDEEIGSYERARKRYVRQPSATTELLNRGLYPEEINELMEQAAKEPLRRNETHYERMLRLAERYDDRSGNAISSNKDPHSAPSGRS